MMPGTAGSVIDSAAFEDVSTSVALAVWSDGSTVHSAVVRDGDGIHHEYRVCRCGQVLAKLPSVAAVEDWRLERADRIPDVLGVDSAA